MQLRQSERRKAKIKMALQGSAGSGKTYSSLLLAQGLTNGDFSKVAIRQPLKTKILKNSLLKIFIKN